VHRIAEFHKVSRNQFQKDFLESVPAFCCEEVNHIYDSIPLPFRATKGSAGYEITTPCSVCLQPGESVKIPTGLNVEIQEGWVLLLFPKSGLGFRYRLQLDNTVGVVDSDYYGARNEGHIMIQITNDSKKEAVLELEAGKAFAQGVFVPFGVTLDDQTDGVRVGGFGSTEV
jgi:dUTP pyrophosphatase